jgi:hypothetical protein
MNLKKIAQEWLMEHGNKSFEDKITSLHNLLEEVAYYEGYIGDNPEYDPQVGNDTKCLCGHSYYRHFDPYEGMAPVGCKYCTSFSLKAEEHGNRVCTGFKPVLEGNNK